MGSDGHTNHPSPLHQRLVRDALWLGRRNRMVHGLFELDVTGPRRRIDDYEGRTGESLSFTAFLTTCLAEAVDRHKELHVYRNWRNDLVVFDDVDVLVLIERTGRETEGPVPYIVRAANGLTATEIHDEIRAIQHHRHRTEDEKLLRTFAKLPTPIRRLTYRLIGGVPGYRKRVGGTVAVTSVGMFGGGGGWAIPVANHTLQLTVGGIDRKPGVVDDEIQIREYLGVTLSVNHEIVDGASAARFGGEFRTLVEDGYGLPD